MGQHHAQSRVSAFPPAEGSQQSSAVRQPDLVLPFWLSASGFARARTAGNHKRGYRGCESVVDGRRLRRAARKLRHSWRFGHAPISLTAAGASSNDHSGRSPMRSPSAWTGMALPCSDARRTAAALVALAAGVR